MTSASNVSFAKQAARRGLRALYWLHRLIGIATCVLFAVWFASGVVMMYVPFPALGDAEYVSRLEPIEWDAVELGPTEALAAAGATAYPRQLQLEMLADEPVYSGAPRASASIVHCRGLRGWLRPAARLRSLVHFLAGFWKLQCSSSYQDFRRRISVPWHFPSAVGPASTPASRARTR